MAVVRAVLLALCLLVAAPVAVVAVRFCRPGGHVAQGLGRLFCRAALHLLRVTVVVTGDASPGGRLLVANHVSWIDPLVLFAAAPSVMLAKREVGTWPVIAALSRLQATVLVDRRRRMQVPRVNRTLADRLLAGHNTVLFPEGTTNDGSRRGRFHTSHLACLADVLVRRPAAPASAQAVAIAYSNPAAAWIGDDTLLPHLWATLRRPGMTCHIAFAEPVSVARGFDRKILGRHLAGQVEHLLGSTVGDHARVATRRNGAPGGLIMTEA